MIDEVIKNHKKTILIIDANLARSHNLASRLRSNGYTTEAYSSALQALHVLESASQSQICYLLAILSGDGKEMPMREILDLIRAIPSQETLPILSFLLQEEGDHEDLRAIEKESNAWVTHEDSFQQILAKVESLVTQS